MVEEKSVAESVVALESAVDVAARAPVSDVKTDEIELRLSEVDVGRSDERMELRSDVNESNIPPPV